MNAGSYTGRKRNESPEDGDLTKEEAALLLPEGWFGEAIADGGRRANLHDARHLDNV